MRMMLAVIATAVLAFSQVALARPHSVPGSSSGYYYPDAVNKFLAQLPSLNLTGAVDPDQVCWKGSYGRGVGTAIDTCAAGLEQNGALCYPLCRDTYYGVGPVCWQSCRSGYTDEGALCAINVEIISSDNSACPWYDVCGLVTARGCSHCPDSTWINDGCTCRHDADIYAKDSYGRGAGVPLGCGSNEEEDAALCYPLCKTGYGGVGPVCWESCPKSVSVDEGALCCVEESACDDRIKQMAMGVLAAISAAVEGGASWEAIENDIKMAIEAILGFVLPTCDSFNNGIAMKA